MNTQEKLEVGKSVIINIPFTYDIGDDGYCSGKTLETIQDCMDEVRSEVSEGLSGEEIMLEVVSTEQTIIPTENPEVCNVITIENGIISNIKTFIGRIDECGAQAEKAFQEITGLTGDDLDNAVNDGTYDNGVGRETIICWSDTVSIH